MASSPDAHQPLSAEAVADALGALDFDAWARLSVASKVRARVCTMPPEDLLREAITRLRSGRRACPPDVPLIVVIDQVMRSIADAALRSREPLEQNAGYESLDDLDVADERTLDPETACLARQVLQQIKDILADDPMAQEVFAAKTLGMSPADTQQELKISAKEYATTLRRIARRLAVLSLGDQS